jgi:hypothetical protein
VHSESMRLAPVVGALRCSLLRSGCVEGQVDEGLGMWRYVLAWLF